MPHIATVTNADIRLIDPADGSVVATPWLYDDDDDERVAQFAALGETLFVTSENEDGGPEVAVGIIGQAGYPYRGPSGHAYIPLRTDVSVTEVARTAGEGDGLTFGLYCARYAVVFRDGSRGPATLPIGVEVGRHASYPYELQTATTATDDFLHVTGTTANDDALALLEAYGGPFPLYVSGYGLANVVASRAESSNTYLTLDKQVGMVLADTTDIALGDRCYVRFITAGALTVTGLTDAERDAIYDRIVILLSPPLEEGADAFASPYFEIGSLPLNEEGDFTYKGTTAATLSKSTYEEGAFTGGVRASRCGALNGRLYLGDITLDPPTPRPSDIWVVDPTPGGSDPLVLLRVAIRTNNGTLYRWSDPFAIDAGAGDAIGHIAYPDPRAFQMDSYIEDTPGAGDYEHAGTAALQPATTIAAAFALEDAGGSGAAPADSVTRAAQNAELDPGPRRLWQSGFGQPYNLNLSRLSETGATTADEVLAIVPLGEALSSGQFGDYPLLVGCKAAWYALRFNDTGDLAGFDPVEAAPGPIGPYAFAVEGSRIFYLASSGLFSIPGPRDDKGNAVALSSPLRAPDGTRVPSGVLYTFTPTSDAAVGVYDDGTRREVWVTTGSGDAKATWVLSLKHSGLPHWSRLDRDRVGYVQLGGGVTEHGAGSSFDAAAIWREDDGTGAGTATNPALEAPRIVTATTPLSNGSRVHVKRAGVGADASGILTFELLTYGATADPSPPGRAVVAESIVKTLSFDPEDRYMTTANAAARWAAFRLTYATATHAAEGDRITKIELDLRPPVRSRRRRLINT